MERDVNRRKIVSKPDYAGPINRDKNGTLLPS